MIIDQQTACIFANYEKSLRLLENAFKEAGLPVEFCPVISSEKEKFVQINVEGRSPRVACIEGDSPVQALKDITAAVKL